MNKIKNTLKFVSPEIKLLRDKIKAIEIRLLQKLKDKGVKN